MLKNKEKMKKFMSILFTVILIAGCSVALGFVITGLSDEYEDAKNAFRKNVGAYCTIGNDTLQIVDYSLFSETYTLSNGLKVDSSFVKVLDQN